MPLDELVSADIFHSTLFADKIIYAECILYGIVTVRMDGESTMNVTSKDLNAMLTAINNHKLRPVIDRVFAFDELRQALDCLSNGKHFGKIGIKH